VTGKEGRRPVLAAAQFKLIRMLPSPAKGNGAWQRVRCRRHGVGCQHDTSFLIRHMITVTIVRPRNVTHGDAARCHARRMVGMSPCPPGFVRVVLTCRACAEVTVLDLHAAVIARRYPGVPLARFSWRCSACLSDDLDIDVRPEPSQRRG
jgi:hypothetical protein